MILKSTLVVVWEHPVCCWAAKTTVGDREYGIFRSFRGDRSRRWRMWGFTVVVHDAVPPNAPLRGVLRNWYETLEEAKLAVEEYAQQRHNPDYVAPRRGEARDAKGFFRTPTQSEYEQYLVRAESRKEVAVTNFVTPPQEKLIEVELGCNVRCLTLPLPEARYLRQRLDRAIDAADARVDPDSKEGSVFFIDLSEDVWSKEGNDAS